MNFNFGNNLKRLRLAKSYTQEQAAEKLNVSLKAISRWECSNAMPDIMMLPEIAKLPAQWLQKQFIKQGV